MAEDLAGTPDGGSYALMPGTVVSSLAREEAQRRGIAFVETGPGTVALGSDHGGFAMKQAVKALLEADGAAVLDLGVHSEEPVDYPDIAREVALAVAEGRCSWGIVVDGAGIGSCIAANKVPGVRAALCYDEATARNSREHNFANVLTLGGRMISEEAMRTIVRSWLSTPFGAERHRRRIEKIMEIERRFSRR